MKDLLELPNIGKEIKRQLNLVGIKDYDDLINTGSLEAWLKIKEIDSSACYNRLLSLEGAIQNIPKKELSDDDKKWLKDFYNQNKL